MGRLLSCMWSSVIGSLNFAPFGSTMSPMRSSLLVVAKPSMMRCSSSMPLMLSSATVRRICTPGGGFIFTALSSDKHHFGFGLHLPLLRCFTERHQQSDYVVDLF